MNRGLRTSDGIGKLYNIEGAFGGPIKKDSVWFFGSVRDFVLDTLPANTFYGIAGTETPTSAALPSSDQGVDPQSIRSFQARVTWQISAKNKLSVYNDRLLKNRGAAMTAGFDPAEASIVWNSPIYTTGSVKLHVHGDEPDLYRGRSVDQLRALQHASINPACRKRRSRPSGTR